MIQQLTDIFKSTYNKISNVKSTPCDEAYRQVRGVKQIDLVSNDVVGGGAEEEVADEEVGSFVFRRKLGDKRHGAKQTTISDNIPTHHVRIGRSTSQQLRTRRKLEEQEEGDDETWMSISLLFEANVACRGMYCLGDNSELFGPVVIDKNGFSQAYAENVARSLLWKPPADTINDNSSNTNSSSPLQFSTSVKVETVREIEEQSCPVDNELKDFARNVIVEVLVDASSDPFAHPWDPRFETLQEAYVTTYNKLIRNEFCDPHFRRLTGAEVVDIGMTSTATSKNGTSSKLVLPLEIRIYGECKGCDPSAISIYEAPSVMVGPSASSSARYLIGSNSNEDKWRLPFATKTITHNGRTLEEGEFEEEEVQNTFPDKCYCDAQPFGNRAPFESEFVSQFQRTVESLKLDDFSSVHKCRFGTTFSTGIVMSVTQEEAKSIQDPNSNTKTILETSLKSTLNDLLAVTPTTCNKDFRVIENVTLVVNGTNISRDTNNLQLPSVANATIKNSNEGIRRLSDYVWDQPTIRILNATENDSSINCFDPAASNILTIVGCCEHQKEDSVSVSNTTTVQCYDTPEVKTPAPSYSPFDPHSLAGGTSVPILFFVSGICSGCDDSLLTGLANDVVRMLSKQAPTASLDSQLPRKLEEDDFDDHHEDQKATSDCFCPINSTVSSGEIDAFELSELFQEYLENEDIEGIFEILDEVDVVDCDDVENEFFTVARITVEGDLNDSDIDWLAYAFMDTYNYLNPLYCDPFFRKINDVEEVFVVVNSKRKARRNLAGCTETEIELHLKGTCIGCDDGHPLFDDPYWYEDYWDDGYYERRDLKSLFREHKVSTVHNPLRNTRRRLQQSNVCYCVGETIADRAPSFDEFLFVYKEEVRFVPNVCDLVDIYIPDGDYVPLDDDDHYYHNHDDYYENFFLRTYDETIPPEFYIETDVPSEEEETSNPEQEEETSNPEEGETSNPEEEGTSDPEQGEATSEPSPEGSSEGSEEGSSEGSQEGSEEGDIFRDGTGDDTLYDDGLHDDVVHDDEHHEEEWEEEEWVEEEWVEEEWVEEEWVEEEWVEEEWVEEELVEEEWVEEEWP